MNITTTSLQKKTVQKIMTMGKLIALENVKIYHPWECDVFAVDKDGYAWEFEIKSTRRDYLADKNKELKLHNTSNGMGANYFTYVTVWENGVNNSDEIPEFAGWMEMNKYGNLTMYKPPPILKQEKVDAGIWEELAMKLFFKHTNFGI